MTSVDALRGLVMMIMALDHVRDFHHRAAMSFKPEDLTRTTAATFFTRWITHFCAPVFMLTAGLAAFYWLERGRTKRQLADFLIRRGFWLILIDLSVLRFIIFFNLTSGPMLLNVLWALGWCMIALAGMARLPVRVLCGVSLAMIALHNLADPIRAASFGGWAWIWNVFHQQGVFRIGSLVVLTAYPLVPWIGVMGAGFCLGRIIGKRTLIFRIGLAMTIAFVVLRGFNIYGDPQKWSVQSSAVLTVLSFLRCNKYPPSLDFLLMTLGPALMVLAWFGGKNFSARNPLVVFGRTPLFYFLAHLLLAHLLAFPVAWYRYGRGDFLLLPMPNMGGSSAIYPPGFGLDLGGVYVVWIIVVLVMYPLCLWFRGVKERHRGGWLSYL